MLIYIVAAGDQPIMAGLLMGLLDLPRRHSWMVLLRDEVVKDQYMYGRQETEAQETTVTVMVTLLVLILYPLDQSLKVGPSLGTLRNVPLTWPPPIAVVPVDRDELSALISIMDVPITTREHQQLPQWLPAL
jgi:hypothetical protein